MKTFQRFKQDMNEAVPLAIPAGIALKTGLGSLLGSSAIKSAVAGALTGGALTGAYLASKKINKDKGEEEIQQRKRAEEEEVGKAIGKNPGEPLPKVRKRDIIKGGLEKYKEGLRVAQNPTVAKKYRTPEMGNQDPAKYVRQLQQELKDRLKRQKNEYKRQQIKNKRINKDLDIK